MGVSYEVLIENMFWLVLEYTQGVYYIGCKKQEHAFAGSIYSETEITCITSMQWKRL